LKGRARRARRAHRSVVDWWSVDEGV